MKFLRAGRFWFDFIGDDWTIALAVVVAVAATGSAHHGWNPWWLLPLPSPAPLAASSARRTPTTRTALQRRQLRGHQTSRC
jgi:hypothetical protein